VFDGKLISKTSALVDETNYFERLCISV